MAWIALTMMVACGASAASDSIPPVPGQTVRANKAAQKQPESQQQNPDKTPALVDVTVTNDSQYPASDTQQKTNAEPSKWTDPITLFTGLLFVVGVAQAGIARLQWKTYKAQTEIFTAQNRAHIFLKSLRLEPSGWEGDGKPNAWRVIAAITNSGTTPPRNLRVAIFKSVVPSETVGTLRFEPSYEAAKNAFVGPKSSIDIHAADVYEVGARKKTLVWGWVEYNDVFEPSDRHRTEFCFEFGTAAIINLDDGSTTLLPEFVMYERHNGMDGDCMHKPQPCPA
jgi:hypothetical protein